jgi:peptidoglycan hydrolase-like protein with peptidoglycan-binding domain
MTSPVRLSPRTAATASRQAPRVDVPRQATPRALDGFEQRKSVSVLVLQRGMTGSVVTGLQQKLVSARFMPLADFKSGPGVYGPRTEAAVKRLQEFVGLPVTGVAGPSVFAALNGGARFEPSARRSFEATDVTAPISNSRVLARLSETFSEEVTQPLGVPL